MKMTAEDIEILKELQTGNKSQAKVYDELKIEKRKIEWFRLSGICEWLESYDLIERTDGYPRDWQITSAGMDEIKKWDQQGTQGELFQEVKK